MYAHKAPVAAILARLVHRFPDAADILPFAVEISQPSPLWLEEDQSCLPVIDLPWKQGTNHGDGQGTMEG